MKRNSKSLGKQMARLYIKRYSNPEEYTGGSSSFTNKTNQDSISIFSKKNEKEKT